MKPSGRFKRFIQASEGDTEIIPILYGYLEGGKLPDPFTVKVRGGSGDRPPDGWFHPSTHPLMSVRQLYYYLAEPDQWTPEPFAYTIKMSALIGSVVHDVVETALADLGYLIVPKGLCPACGLRQPTKCREHGAVDEKTGSRGHMDGKLGIGGTVRGFEFKTAMPLTLREIGNNDVLKFKEKWPYYYAQVQEYMRMTGLTSYKIVFWAMGNPWDMREFTIDADPIFQHEVEQKYLSARQAVAHGQVPMEPCCKPGTKEHQQCPAMACPIKKMS